VHAPGHSRTTACSVSPIARRTSAIGYPWTEHLRLGRLEVQPPTKCTIRHRDQAATRADLGTFTVDLEYLHHPRDPTNASRPGQQEVEAGHDAERGAEQQHDLPGRDRRASRDVHPTTLVRTNSRRIGQVPERGPEISRDGPGRTRAFAAHGGLFTAADARRDPVGRGPHHLQRRTRPAGAIFSPTRSASRADDEDGGRGGRSPRQGRGTPARRSGRPGRLHQRAVDRGAAEAVAGPSLVHRRRRRQPRAPVRLECRP
jgi:hypothetical protein